MAQDGSILAYLPRDGAFEHWIAGLPPESRGYVDGDTRTPGAWVIDGDHAPLILMNVLENWGPDVLIAAYRPGSRPVYAPTDRAESTEEADRQAAVAEAVALLGRARNGSASGVK